MSQADGRPTRDEGDGETRQERVNRELIELLNELRVALPGVQFLFAFLLIVPFQQVVEEMTGFQRDVHYVALLAAAVATALLIAPAAQHRVLFRARDKEELLRRSNRYAMTASVVLALAMAAALLLVVDVLFSRELAWLVAAGGLALLLWLWLLQPLQRRSRQG